MDGYLDKFFKNRKKQNMKMLYFILADTPNLQENAKHHDIQQDSQRKTPRYTAR